MKKNILTLVLVSAIVVLSAAPIGKIRFINGEVLYRENQNKPYTKIGIGAPVHAEGYIKTGPDSEVDITWNNSMVSSLASNREISVSKLWEADKATPTFKNKMLDNLHNLRLQSSRRASSEAGIRREEAEVKQDTELFWSSEEKVSIDEGVAAFEAENTKQAIAIFEKVIYQGPLSRDAEMAHGYLTLIYRDLGDSVKAAKELEALKADFPTSPVLDQLPKE